LIELIQNVFDLLEMKAKKEYYAFVWKLPHLCLIM
jgi:hypothetical protein